MDAQVSTPSTRKQRILVVDDEEDMRLLFSMYLEQAGFEVEAADDGEEALKKARRHAPDLILLDIMMPEMHGFEVCRELRYHPETARIPVIMLTSKTAPGYVRKAAALKVDGYIAKPPDPDGMVARIRKVLQGVGKG